MTALYWSTFVYILHHETHGTSTSFLDHNNGTLRGPDQPTAQRRQDGDAVDRSFMPRPTEDAVTFLAGGTILHDQGGTNAHHMTGQVLVIDNDSIFERIQKG